MSGLINNTMSGLNTAQAALNTASSSISSHNVTGYTRQTTTVTQANSTLSAGGWVGNGIYVSDVQREYDASIANRLRTVQAQSSGPTARYKQILKIDSILSTNTSSLATQIRDFFTSLQTLVNNVEDPAARQALIEKSEGMVNQFKTTNQYLRDQDKQVSIAIGASVDQINNYAKQVASLNDQISCLTGVGARASPDDLLDQRDQLVGELNRIVGVEVSVQNGGIYNITMANGYSLVQRSTAWRLAAVPSSADPSHTTVTYVDGMAGDVEIPEKLLNTGSLGGILAFRSQGLDQTRNTLEQLVLAFAEAFNSQHKAGFNTNNDTGEDFFVIGEPATLQNTRNTGSVAIGATVTDTSAVLATDYKISFDNNQWQATRLASSATFMVTPDADGKVAFNGLGLILTGTPAVNDSFTLKPVGDAIVNVDVLITDEVKIAMVSEEDAGDSDNRNGQALLDLQSNSKTVGDARSFSDAYASLMNNIGNRAVMLKTSSATQDNVVTQPFNQQQLVSGVNLDEEYGNLQRFQQYYLANAQVLQTANAIFDMLTNVHQGEIKCVSVSR